MTLPSRRWPTSSWPWPRTQRLKKWKKVLNLNETGAIILRALQDGADTPAIVTQLLAEYDVTPQEAETEVNAFIDMLKENGIAQI